MITLEKIEELYEAHDELLENSVRKGDRDFADESSFRRLFRWQFTEYYSLLRRCITLNGEDCEEFKQARKYLRQAEGLARGSVNLRRATAIAEMAIQYIHRWLEITRSRLRKEGCIQVNDVLTSPEDDL